jgi:hypothetical protein
MSYRLRILRDMSGAVIMITDSGMLMGEVLASSRRLDGSPGGRITSLLWALHRGGAVLILPRHILEEVERDLPRRARETDDIELAYRRLRALYLSRAQIVDVPSDWSLSDPRVQALAQRHRVDLPAAQLAVTIGGCFLLSEDPDLCDIPGLGVSAWLQVTHAAANEIEVESYAFVARIPVNVAELTIEGAYRRITAASPATQLACGIAAGIIAVGGFWLFASGKASKFLDRAKPVIKEIGRVYGPPLLETLQRHNRGRLVFSHAVVTRAESQTLGERIARVLAYASEPLLAVDIARELETPGSLRDRTKLVRGELQSCGAFAEVTRGRWVLGRPSGYESAPLSPVEVMDYQERLHKDAHRLWEQGGQPVTQRS